jgi:hypothetical protein
MKRAWPSSWRPSAIVEKNEIASADKIPGASLLWEIPHPGAAGMKRHGLQRPLDWAAGITSFMSRQDRSITPKGAPVPEGLSLTFGNR